MRSAAQQDWNEQRDAAGYRMDASLSIEHLEPVVSRARARELLNTPKFPRLTRFWRALRLNDPHLQAQIRKQECVWLPFYHIRFAMAVRSDSSLLDCTLDSWSGAFAIVSFESPIEDGPPPGEHFPPHMAQQEAETRAYDALLHTVMRQRSRGNKPMPQAVAECRLLYWPFWVLYIQRKRHLDLRLLDAVTAQPGGNRTKIGLLNAFTAAHQASREADQRY